MPARRRSDLLVALACAAALTGCSGQAAGSRQRLVIDKGTSTLGSVDSVVRAVSSARDLLMRDVGAVQAAAVALDAADATCARGDGVPARTVLRQAAVPADRAATALRRLPHELTTYAGALGALDRVRRGLRSDQAAALGSVASSGRAEVAAAQTFRGEAGALWPSYRALLDDEQTWVTRALTPWYRSASEGAAAYAVLVSDRRPALQRARNRLAAAAAALQAAVQRQQQVLAAADRVLRSG